MEEAPFRPDLLLTFEVSTAAFQNLLLPRGIFFPGELRHYALTLIAMCSTGTEKFTALFETERSGYHRHVEHMSTKGLYYV
jgi:hypothetical protein